MDEELNGGTRKIKSDLAEIELKMLLGYRLCVIMQMRLVKQVPQMKLREDDKM